MSPEKARMLEAQEASNQALLDDLHQGFYTDEFDAEKHELEVLALYLEQADPSPEEMRQTASMYIQTQVATREAALQLVTEKLNPIILSKYQELVDGMEAISELGKDLQQMSALVKNSRRFLKLAEEDLLGSGQRIIKGNVDLKA